MGKSKQTNLKERIQTWFKKEKSSEKQSVSISEVKRKLRRERNMRKILMCIFKENPVKIGEIEGDCDISRKTIYSRINLLADAGVVDKVVVDDIYNKNEKTEIQKKIIEKFDDWAGKMGDKTWRLYKAKTHYFVFNQEHIDLVKLALKIENHKSS